MINRHRDGAEEFGSTQTDIQSLVAIVDRAVVHTDEKEVTVQTILRSFGHGSFAPFLLIPSLAVVTPLSGIPLFSSLCGITICLVSIQWLMGRDHIWLPGWIMRRTVDTQRFNKALTGFRPWAKRLDRFTKRRLDFLFVGPLYRAPLLLCAFLGATMPFLELVPFSSSFIGAAVTLLTLSVLTKDGLLEMVATIPVGLVIAGIVSISV